MRELAQVRMRYGYRRLHVLLRREGWNLGRELAYRLYTEEACNCAANDRAVARWSLLAASDTFPNGATRLGRWILSPINSPMAAS
jgi:hypothetical protein